MNIRKAMIPDLSRVAEIYVFNNRINYFPIFKEAGFSFGKLQVVSLIEFAIQEFQVDHVWALEKNIRAISFYQKHGFYMTGQKKFEEGTAECIVELEL